jgi:alpha-D-xyloside xylohydrolase
VDRPRLVGNASQPARPAADFKPRDPHWIQRALAARRDGRRLRLRCEDERGARVAIEVLPVAPDMVRIHVGPGADRPSRLLVEAAPASTEWELSEIAEGWQVELAKARLRIERDPFRLSLLDGSGRVRFAEERYDREVRGRYHNFPSGHASGLRWLTAGLRPEEALFGLGEHFGSLNRRGQAITSWTVDAFGVRAERAYKNCPLLLSSLGYAVFLDMTEPLHFDLGQASVAAWQVVARSRHLRWYLIAADDYRSQIGAYHRLTGSPAVPPAWSFGLWMSRWGYRNREQLMEVARRLRAEEIPCDVLHLDPYWLRYHEGHHGDLTWDEEAFPDPRGMIEELRQLGFRLSLWESPYLPLDSAMFQEGARRGFLLRDRSGEVALVRQFSKPSAAVDFTHPGATAWFKDRNRRLLEMGVAVMKSDFAEDMPEDAVAHDGSRAEELHNLYPLLYQRAVFEATQEVHGYGITWGRSGYAGSQRYPVQWGGDPGATFSDMAASLRGALSWILSGMSFASFDMGGFFGVPVATDPPSEEVYIRWSQMGLLFSHARAHGHTAPREPWAYGPRALEIFRRYARLRYRLLPYLYSAALLAPHGIPVVRPLLLDYPRDRTTQQVDDEYLLGPDLLVAPMFTAEGERDVYLPGTGWYDYWSDALLEGGRWHRVRAELKTLPLYVRAGATIPLGPATRWSDEQSWDPLSFEIYPGPEQATEFELQDDRRRLRFKLRIDRSAARLEGGPLDYAATVRVHVAGGPVREGKLGESIRFSPGDAGRPRKPE